MKENKPSPLLQVRRRLWLQGGRSEKTSFLPDFPTTHHPCLQLPGDKIGPHIGSEGWFIGSVG
jgi:hypothetical protein